MNNEERQEVPEQQLQKPTGKTHDLSYLQIVICMWIGFVLAVIFWDRGKNVDVKDPIPVPVKYAEVLKLFQENYIEEIDPDKFTEEILKGGISKASDPYSYYEDQESVEKYNEELTGKYAGIGASLEAKENSRNGLYQVIVVTVFKDSPAQKAGLQAGDVIRAVSSTHNIDSQVFAEKVSLGGLVNLVRGEAGTQVKLWIQREGKIKEVVLVRGIVKVETVSFKKIQKGVGYIKLTRFIGNTDCDFVKAANALVVDGAKVLIIDVRDNPGGLLHVVFSIINNFRTDSDPPPVYTKGRDRDYESYSLEPGLLQQLNQLIEDLKATILGKRTRFNANLQDLKVVVLINGYSASASELLAGWFKEEFGAPIVGEKSFGKGSVQRPFKLTDGSQIVMTIEHYFIGKNKVPVHGIGIEPTIMVKNKGEEDKQLKKAIETAAKLLK